MNRYRFEVHEEIITPVEVMAESEQEARERVSQKDSEVTAFDAIRGAMRIVLRAVVSE